MSGTDKETSYICTDHFKALANVKYFSTLNLLDKRVVDSKGQVRNLGQAIARGTCTEQIINKLNSDKAYYPVKGRIPSKRDLMLDLLNAIDPFISDHELYKLCQKLVRVELKCVDTMQFMRNSCLAKYAIAFLMQRLEPNYSLNGTPRAFPRAFKLLLNNTCADVLWEEICKKKLASLRNFIFFNLLNCANFPKLTKYSVDTETQNKLVEELRKPYSLLQEERYLSLGTIQEQHPALLSDKAIREQRKHLLQQWGDKQAQHARLRFACHPDPATRKVILKTTHDYISELQRKRGELERQRETINQEEADMLSKQIIPDGAFHQRKNMCVSELAALNTTIFDYTNLIVEVSQYDDAEKRVNTGKY